MKKRKRHPAPTAAAPAASALDWRDWAVVVWAVVVLAVFLRQLLAALG